MSPFEIRSIDHVVLRCSDIDAMLKFYRDVLGCALAKHNTRLGLFHLSAGTTMIDLVDVKGGTDRPGPPAPEDAGRNMDHFCLRIDPFDPAQLGEYLRAKGFELQEVHTRFGAEGDGVSGYLFDPEGNKVELKGCAPRAA